MSKTDPPTPPENREFASELIKARNDLGLTQSQLAEKSKVSLSAIKGYETGRNMPGARELRELCVTLKVTPNKLLFGEDSPFQPLGANDPAKSLGSKGLAVQRGRISSLASLLSYDESYAIYTLIHSIAMARHGEGVVTELLITADLMTGIYRLKDGNPVDMDLFPKDADFLKSFQGALEASLKSLEDGVEIDPITIKVSKK